MKFKYILLNAMTPEDFGLDNPTDLIEAVEEFGCKVLKSHDTTGQTTYYAISDTPEAMINMTETVELPGIVLEYTAVFDQFLIGDSVS